MDMIKHHYPTLFPKGTDEHEIVSDLALRTFEFCEFLVKVLNLTQLGSHFPHGGNVPRLLPFIAGLGLKDEAKILLNEVQDILYSPAARRGCLLWIWRSLFSVVYPDVSKVMMERKIANIEGTGAEYVTACDAGCLMNIGGGLKKINSRVNPGTLLIFSLRPDRRLNTDKPVFIDFKTYSENVPLNIPSAVQLATDRFIKNRARRVEELPQWEQLRQTASDIRSQTLTNLDEWLEIFERNFTAQGGQVHWAENDSRHRRLCSKLPVRTMRSLP